MESYYYSKKLEKRICLDCNKVINGKFCDSKFCSKAEPPRDNEQMQVEMEIRAKNLVYWQAQDKV